MEDWETSYRNAVEKYQGMYAQEQRVEFHRRRLNINQTSFIEELCLAFQDDIGNRGWHIAAWIVADLTALLGLFLLSWMGYT